MRTVSDSKKRVLSKIKASLKFIVAPIVLGIAMMLALYGILLVCLGEYQEISLASKVKRKEGDTKCRSQTPIESS